MIFALLFILGQAAAAPVVVTDPTYQSQRVTTTSAGGKRGLDVNCVSGCAAGTGAPTLVYILDAGPPINVNPIVVSGAVSVNILDAGPPLNVNPVAIASLPALPAGTNVIGHAIIDTGSTTAVTGNVTVVQGTGTNLHAVLDSTSTTAVTQATGTNLHAVLDTTSTTAVTQATAANLNAQVVGAAASGASKAGNPVQTGAVFNTAQPTVTTGQAVEVQATARGAVIVASGVDAIAVNNTQQGTAAQNVTQFGGTNVSTGTGASGAGIPRVTISNDSALAANQSVNLAQVAGATTSTGNGTAAGSLRVSVASDSTGTIAATQSGTWTDRVVGNAGAAIDAANNASAPANVIADGFEAAALGTTQPTAASASNMRRAVVGTDGVLYVREGGPVQWSAFVQGVTATTSVRAAPASGIRAYVTSISCSNQAATVQTIDVVFGTGANCVTTATALTHKWQMGTVATTTSPFVFSVYFPQPLVPTAANLICVRPSAATAFGCTVTGYDAP